LKKFHKSNKIKCFLLFLKTLRVALRHCFKNCDNFKIVSFDHWFCVNPGILFESYHSCGYIVSLRRQRKKIETQRSVLRRRKFFLSHRGNRSFSVSLGHFFLSWPCYECEGTHSEMWFADNVQSSWNLSARHFLFDTRDSRKLCQLLIETNKILNFDCKSNELPSESSIVFILVVDK